MEDAIACLGWLRDRIDLRRPSRQGYALVQALILDPEEVEDPSIELCRQERYQSEIEGKRDRLCRRRVYEDRRTYLLSVLAAEARIRDEATRELARQIAELEKKPDGSGHPAALEAKRGALDATRRIRNRIGEAIALPHCSSLVRDHRCYDNWFAEFSVGGEYNTVEDILGDELLPRTGLLIYRNYSSYERWRRPHLFGEVLLTGSGESTRVADIPGLGEGGGESDQGDDQGGGDEEGSGESGDPQIDAEEAEIKPTLDARAGVFWPLWRIGSKVRHERTLQEQIGVIGEVGLRKVDDVGSVDKRYYGGLRLSFSPQWYFDVLYGKTENSPGRRFEIRGQMPVIERPNGNHVHLGALANIRASNSETERSVGDTVQVYLTWNVDFSSLFGN